MYKLTISFEYPRIQKSAHTFWLEVERVEGCKGSLNLYFCSFLRVDGGISNNDFVLELMSSLTCQTLDRPSQTDMSTLGAAFLAGLAAGK